jgi:hypothetical protein
MRSGRTGEIRSSDIDYGKLHHTLVEVLDPAAGRLLASLRIERPVLSVLPAERAAFAMELPDGSPAVQIVQLTLNR